jgi:hypothetical protein
LYCGWKKHAERPDPIERDEVGDAHQVARGDGEDIHGIAAVPNDPKAEDLFARVWPFQIPSNRMK